MIYFTQSGVLSPLPAGEDKGEGEVLLSRLLKRTPHPGPLPQGERE